MRFYLHICEISLKLSCVFHRDFIENEENSREMLSRKKQGCEEYLGMLEYISCLFGQNVLKCR